MISERVVTPHAPSPSLCNQTQSPLSHSVNQPLAMRKNQGGENTPRIFLLLTATLTILIFYYSPYIGRWITSPFPSPYSRSAKPVSGNVAVETRKCDIFKGQWVPNPEAPYYTNASCSAIDDKQNCMKFGRPDTDYMRWRWKPNDCELAVFNPEQFLELMRGKSMAFVGDSVGRNQMESLMCLLSRVAGPVESPTSNHNFKLWHYPSYNFTLAGLWSTYLITMVEGDPLTRNPITGLIDILYLDEPDVNWFSQVHHFDYTIFSVGHWFWRPTLYYLNHKLVGCYACNQPNVTSLPMYYGFRHAFRTAFAALNDMESYKGVTVLRTYSPDHFEGGAWNNGGDCVRTKPFSVGEKRLEGFQLETYTTQVEEYTKAAREGGQKGRRFGLLDTTEVMVMRPDGHPGRYGHPAGENSKLRDCVHWCLPGPVDTWNDFLLHIMKMEGSRGLSFKEG